MIDEILEYPGFGECESLCRIRINLTQTNTIAIASELPNNPGTSITNCPKSVRERAILRFGLPPSTTWIEHYPGTQTLNRKDIVLEESFSIVTFNKSGPQWKYISRSQVEELIGGKLEE